MIWVFESFAVSGEGFASPLTVEHNYVRYIRHMVQDLGKRANVLRRPVAVLGLWHRVRRLHCSAV
jgi:hypothetical protein